MERIETIREVLREVNGCGEVNAESELKSDVGLDSLSLVSVIVGLEDKFGVTFDDGDLNPAELLTVGDLVRLVEKTL